MNYRHQFHAGNFADAVKHAALVGLIRALQRKPAGFLYIDTHAGRGSYALAGAAPAGGRPEHPDGIGRLLGRTDLPEPVADYVDRVRAFGERHAGAYPGSPSLAAGLARPQDRLAFFETQPAERAALGRLFAGARRVSVRPSDGYGALRALLPPPERRALVLIDPPYEDEGESGRILAALGEGLRRLPRAVCAVWYPLADRMPAGELLRGLRRLAPTPCLVTDVIVAPEAPGLRGCGLAILNPPWRFERETEPAAAALAAALAQSARSSWSVRWLTSQAATSSSGG